MGVMLASCLWVLAASATAMLPLRRQMAPGVLLLLPAPALLAWIGAAAGWGWLALALLAFGSLFRRPLGHLLRRARGRPSPSFADLLAQEEGRS